MRLTDAPHFVALAGLGHEWQLVARYDWTSATPGRPAPGVTWMGDLDDPLSDARRLYVTMVHSRHTVVQVTTRIDEGRGILFARIRADVDPAAAVQDAHNWLNAGPALRAAQASKQAKAGHRRLKPSKPKGDVS